MKSKQQKYHKFQQFKKVLSNIQQLSKEFERLHLRLVTSKIYVKVEHLRQY